MKAEVVDGTDSQYGYADPDKNSQLKKKEDADAELRALESCMTELNRF
jgi:hypothetical protein